MTEENIFVIRTELFRKLGYFQGFSSEVERYRQELFSPENILFLPRSLAENDPDYKQLIPYMFFCWKDPQDELKIFTYVRGKGMGEARLHHRISIGVGGHLNDQDQHRDKNSYRDLYRDGMMREFHEEVQVDTTYSERCVGLINDDSNEVGRVHLGVVHRFDLAEPKLIANEKDLLESGFRSIHELQSTPQDRFESWTSITLNALFQ